MKHYEVVFTLPTGFLGADITDERDYDFSDDVSEGVAKGDIGQDFEDWLDEQLDDMRNASYIEWA